MSIDDSCSDPGCKPLKVRDFRAVPYEDLHDKVKRFDKEFSDGKSWEDKSLKFKLDMGLLSRYDAFMIRAERNNPRLYEALRFVGFPDYKKSE